jgi:endonuclease III
MLSSQTKDEVTHEAVAKIRTAAGGEITLENMLAMSTETLQGAINKVGFWPKKTTCVPPARVEHDQTHWVDCAHGSGP